MTAIRVLIVDDSAVIRRRVVSLLSEIKGVHLVGEAAAVETAHHGTDRRFVGNELANPFDHRRARYFYHGI